MNRDFQVPYVQMKPFECGTKLGMDARILQFGTKLSNFVAVLILSHCQNNKQAGYYNGDTIARRKNWCQVGISPKQVTRSNTRLTRK